ncbi:MAG: hypothetical protein F6J97_26750, partial [Leptolyngbya sp. SIO4C1]|nr:hypothetical protein [Leptolyngbya sp. SIO4C1]
WQIATTSQLVDRGIVPLVGIALLFTGFWIESYVGSRPRRANLLLDARFWTCVLSTILGIVFLILTFVHPNNVRLQSQEALTQVAQEADQAASELEQRLGAEVSQQRSQIDTLLQDQERLNQAVESGQVTEEQAAQIEQFRQNPEAVDDYLQQQAAQLETRLKTEIGSRRDQATGRVRLEALKASIRIAASSLLLAIGYTAIGWLGLRRLLSSTAG